MEKKQCISYNNHTKRYNRQKTSVTAIWEGRKGGKEGRKEGKKWRGTGAETNIKTNKTTKTNLKKKKKQLCAKYIASYF